MSSEFHLPRGSSAIGPYELEVTPASAGWGYSSLRVLTLTAAGSHSFATGSAEVVVLPLSGSASVEAAGTHLELRGRTSVFAGPTDFAYLPIDSRVRLHSERGGRFALAGAVTDRVLSARYLGADQVAVELRGAGPSSRQVRNFGTPDGLDAGALIACEVITPGGNWSSYPAHKHDTAGAEESELEEIYYFEIAGGPAGEPGFGYMQTSSSPGHPIDLLAEVRDGDAVLVPHGWHGPCVAAPGFDMYYLNVMAGPGAREWLISDHPDQAWVRGTWADAHVDPRLRPAGEDAEDG